MDGIIGIHHQRINCIIGINPDERIKEQEILIDVKVRANFAACVDSDDIKDTVNYLRIAEICIELAQRSYFLLETLASDILDQLLKDFSINWAWVCIKKPSAIPIAEYTLVELERAKKE